MNTRGGAVVEKEIEWVVAHEALSRLARTRAAADAEEGRWLLAALRAAAHVHLGFGSFAEYIERLFGYQPRSIQERLRVAEALEQLPALAQALEQGTLHWSAVRELTRVAVPENEREWLAVARGKTVRQLEELVAGKCPGDDPSSPHQPDARRHVLRFEVAPETFALFREALTALRRSTDSALDDDAALLAMARHVLGGPLDEGRASYQIALSVCSECGRGQQLAGGELVPVGAEFVRMAQCDAQHIGHIAPHPANENPTLGGPLANDNAHGAANAPTRDGPLDAPVGATSNAENNRLGAHTGGTANAEKRPTRRPDGRDTSAEGARLSAHVDADSNAEGARLSARVDANGHEFPEAEVAPAAKGHIGHSSRVGPRNAPSPRATQTIPPALRRAVLLRDHRRCRVPGCRNSRFLDLHHLELRSERGPNEPENLLTLCGAHHGAAHRGELLIEHSPTASLLFRHADGCEYGGTIQPRTLEAHAKVFSALRGLGFREGEVRAALAQLREDSDLRAATTEQLLRAALACLTPPRARP